MSLSVGKGDGQGVFLESRLCGLVFRQEQFTLHPSSVVVMKAMVVAPDEYNSVVFNYVVHPLMVACSLTL